MKVCLGGTALLIQGVKEVETLIDLPYIRKSFATVEWNKQLLRLDCSFLEKEAEDFEHLQCYNGLSLDGRASGFGNRHQTDLIEEGFNLNLTKLISK